MAILTNRIKGTKAGKITAEVLLNSSKRYICHEGGARSGKTYGIIQVLIQFCEARPGLKVTVVSHSLPHLKRGALRDFLEIMNNWGWYTEDNHNRTDNVYHFDNGSYMEFIGLEDSDKARGAGRMILFCNEANLIKKDVFDQLDIRTKEKVIIDLNPADFNSWCYELADSPDSVKVHSTYKDNRYLELPQIRLIESYRDVDPEGLMWKVFGLGERGCSSEQIYTHWKIVDELPTGDIFYGLDFGFTNPTSLVRCVLSEGEVYVKEEIYQTGLTSAELVAKMREIVKPGENVYCDSADARSIEELYREGFNVYQSDKDVWAGIMKVKSLPLSVTRDSKNIIRELGSYKWKVDKNGVVLDEVVKENDHSCDALRYAIYTRLKNPVISWGAI